VPEFQIGLVVLLIAVIFGAVILAGRYNIVRYRV
ncbi:MAG: hypothetical protein HMLIMOIP_001934, partial [Candidatus Nitrosomirales archaeon]